MLPSCMVDATYPRPLFSFLKLAAARPPVPQHFPLSVFGFASAPKLFRPPHLRAPFARRMRSSANLSLSFPLTPLLSISTSDKPRPKSFRMRSSMISAPNFFRMRSSEKRWGEGRLWLTNSPSTAKFRPSSIPPDQRFPDVSSFFSHSCALFCTFLHASKTQLFCFQSIPHSLPKTTGGGGTPNVPTSVAIPNPYIPTSLLHYFLSSPVRPIAANRPWCHNWQRRENSSPSGETTPLPPVSKNRERTSGTVRRLSRSHPDSVGVASRSSYDRTRKKAWVHRSNVGPQQGGPSNFSVQDGECACIRQGCW